MDAGEQIRSPGQTISWTRWALLVTSHALRAFEQPKEGELSSLPSREDEKDLVERAKQDPAAFGELYDRHFLQIYRFVYSRVRDQTVAEDVTSEVFVKALRGIGRYQDTGRPFSAWLYQISVNAVNDRFRASRSFEDIEEQRDLTAAGPSLEEVAAQRDEGLASLSLNACGVDNDDSPRAQALTGNRMQHAKRCRGGSQVVLVVGHEGATEVGRDHLGG